MTTTSAAAAAPTCLGNRCGDGCAQPGGRHDPQRREDETGRHEGRPGGPPLAGDDRIQPERGEPGQADVGQDQDAVRGTEARQARDTDEHHVEQGCPEGGPEAGGDQEPEEQAGGPVAVENATDGKRDRKHPGVEDVTRVEERDVPEVVVDRVPEVVRDQAGRKEAGMDLVCQDRCVGLLLAQDQMRVFERAQELHRCQPGADQEGSCGDGGPAGDHLGDGLAAGAPRPQRSGPDRHHGPQPGCHPDVVGDLGVPRHGTEARAQPRQHDPLPEAPAERHLEAPKGKREPDRRPQQRVPGGPVRHEPAERPHDRPCGRRQGVDRQDPEEPVGEEQ